MTAGRDLAGSVRRAARRGAVIVRIDPAEESGRAAGLPGGMSVHLRCGAGEGMSRIDEQLS